MKKLFDDFEIGKKVKYFSEKFTKPRIDKND
jgi:hypothetical protein